MNWIDLLGHLGALVIIATCSMKTMIPLRVTGIIGSCIFITYGCLSGTWPVLVLHRCLRASSPATSASWRRTSGARCRCSASRRASC
jgi:hypothetical protein